MPEPAPPAFTAPIILVDMLTGTRQALVTGAPCQALTLVDAAPAKHTVAAEQHACVLDSWAATCDGQDEPFRSGDVLRFMERFAFVTERAPGRDRWAYGAASWVKFTGCSTYAEAR